MKIREDEFIQIRETINVLIPIIRDLDLVGFIDACDRADTIGPIVDPTLWIRNGPAMRLMRSMAVKLLEVQREITRQIEVIETGSHE